MAMKYVCAYIMVLISGKKAPTEKEVSKVLSSVGVTVEDDILKKFMEAVDGKDVEELIASGMTKLQSLPTGGGGGGGKSSGASSGASAAASEEKKEEKKEEEEEEDDMGFSLFD